MVGGVGLDSRVRSSSAPVLGRNAGKTAGVVSEHRRRRGDRNRLRGIEPAGVVGQNRGLAIRRDLRLGSKRGS